MIPSPLILNVDDYQPARYARTRVLSRAGFRVEEAATGQQALAMLNSRPEVVLLDINLPDLSGLEVCRRIKENPETASTIVMHLSASSVAPADAVRGLNNGADTYITEPVHEDVLLATIRSLLRARAAEEALQRSHQDLQNLTHMLSHELREPIRAVTAHVELLKRNLAGKVSAQEAESLDFALAGARHLADLIEGALLYSRTIHEVRNQTLVDAGVALSDAIQEQELLIAETGARIERGPMPLVYASATCLTRVLSNLLSNALKYRGKEPPVIAFDAQAQEKYWVFTVRDNGIGIDSSYHKIIFEAFQRLEKSKVSGTGLGLALSRRVIEDLGGRLWVESTPGKGSTFHFTVPKSITAADI